MANTPWMIKGPEIVTCNCDFGCPCQFNSLPSNGDCRAAVCYRIDEGYHGDTRLDGLLMAGLFAWPEAIHMGRGEAQAIIDERADAAQRASLLKIFHGEDTEPGTIILNVFSSVIDTYHDPLFLPIDFAVDVGERTGHFRIPGVIDATSDPILNPVSGLPHRARIDLPHGFEYTVAEISRSTVATHGDAKINLAWTDAHGHFADLHWTNDGVVRA